MEFVCLDLEGVLVPEVWIAVAERTGIDALKATTRDVPDYDRLMRQRLEVLDTHGLTITDIQAVIRDMAPLKGAKTFLNRLRTRFQVAILSDTYYQFATPLMEQLGWPTLFCHDLEVDDDGRIVGYHLRDRDQKRRIVDALRSLNFSVIAAGDSYNDTAMLEAADAGFLFRAPDNVVREFPQFPVIHDFAALEASFANASEQLAKGALNR